MDKVFSNEVQKELEYYVYRLIDPRNGETFYIGKGKGNRIFNHVYDETVSDKEYDELDLKLQRIREIKQTGLNVLHIIHRHGMNEKTSLEVEAALIDAYPGCTNIMGGTGSNDFGPMHSDEIIAKYVAIEADIEHKIIFINVNQTNTSVALYTATRYAWKVDKNRAEKAEYILSTFQGTIIGVFKPEKWLEATIENFPGFTEVPGRFGFIGHEAEDNIKELYLKKRVPIKYRKKGAANPIKYTYD